MTPGKSGSSPKPNEIVGQIESGLTEVYWYWHWGEWECSNRWKGWTKRI